MHTINGGRDWKIEKSNVSALIFKRVYFDQHGKGWLSTTDKVYRTFDFGKTWNLILEIPKNSVNAQ